MTEKIGFDSLGKELSKLSACTKSVLRHKTCVLMKYLVKAEPSSSQPSSAFT
ncbi:hypothetical protein CERSUDRAFT_101502 [Gelatoporia subvermispora B]|uniref:Uncharacterized protein n=1 Tax=Ceriporiopsis subvermispora (strain B) TaxID=914234 RepID=M2QV03_CERS8|nr:hypothetical protein CERSUDRAFT_101502 [Gelatoporia subvermispora B]